MVIMSHGESSLLTKLITTITHEQSFNYQVLSTHGWQELNATSRLWSLMMLNDGEWWKVTEQWVVNGSGYCQQAFTNQHLQQIHLPTTVRVQMNDKCVDCAV